jgi:hypothetical protein
MEFKMKNTTPASKQTNSNIWLVCVSVGLIALALGCAIGFVFGHEKRKATNDVAAAEGRAAKQESEKQLAASELRLEEMRGEIARLSKGLENAQAGIEAEKATTNQIKANLVAVVKERDELKTKATAASPARNIPLVQNVEQNKVTAVDDVATFGALTIKIAAKSIAKVCYVSPVATSETSEQKLVIQYNLSTNDGTKQFRYFRGDSSRKAGAFEFHVKDDIGNSYKIDLPPRGSYFIFGTPKGLVQLDRPIDDYVIFEKPVPSAKTLTLQIKAKFDPPTQASYVFPLKIEDINRGGEFGRFIGRRPDLSPFYDTTR